MQQSCVDEDDAWELEQSLGLGSREILVVRVVEAVPFAVAVEEVRAGPSSYFANASRSKGGCGTTMFVYKDDACTARYTTRFRPEGA